MLRLSKKADYALMAVTHLARCGDQESVSARELAAAYDIPVELLAKVLQRLVRRGILDSHQGTRGGYHLARPASAISVSRVIEAVDGPFTVTACSEDDERCEQYARCSVRDPLWRIKDVILGVLDRCTVSDIAADVPPDAPAVLAVGGRRSATAPARPASHR